jgi:hypothetical protein
MDYMISDFLTPFTRAVQSTLCFTCPIGYEKSVAVTSDIPFLSSLKVNSQENNGTCRFYFCVDHEITEKEEDKCG